MAEQTDENQEPQEGQQTNGKEAKKFESNLVKLNAIMKGDTNPLRKVAKDALGGIVEELTKERKEAFAKEIKSDLTNILDNKVKLEREFKQKEQELNKLKEAKYKEFNKALNNLFQKVEDLGDIEKAYTESLKSAK